MLTTLTPEQLEARKHYIGGSDARRIMEGDWLSLWKEKVGLAQPEDTSRNFRAMLGTFTEPFNLYWFHQETGLDVDTSELAKGPWTTEIKVAKVAHGVTVPVGANLDGVVQIRGLPVKIVECKHTHAFNKPEGILRYYFWQVQHQMLASGIDTAAFSVIYGNERWETFDVAADAEAQENLLDAEARFWWHVVNDRAPTDQTPAKIAVQVDVGSRLDLTQIKQANIAGDLAAVWLKHRDAAKAFADAADGLKELVPKDIQVAHGYGLVIARDKKGAATITPLTDKERKKWAL